MSTGKERRQKTEDYASFNTTVLLPMRNEAGRLEKKIERVLIEIADHLKVDLIVVDTGSTDGTSSKCRKILEKSTISRDRWKVIETMAPGKSRGVNLAISEYPNDLFIMM